MAKSRTVVVTVEAETDLSTENIKREIRSALVGVKQIIVAVVDATKPKKKSRT